MAPTTEQEIHELRSLFRSERDPDGRAFVSLADAYRRSGDFDQALGLLEEGLQRHPTFASAHVVAAWVQRDRGRPEDAASAFQAVLELDEENGEALRGLGDLAVAAGREGEAIEWLGRLSVLEPSNEALARRIQEIEWARTALATDASGDLTAGLDLQTPDAGSSGASPVELGETELDLSALDVGGVPDLVPGVEEPEAGEPWGLTEESGGLDAFALEAPVAEESLDEAAAALEAFALEAPEAEDEEEASSLDEAAAELEAFALEAPEAADDEEEASPLDDAAAELEAFAAGAPEADEIEALTPDEAAAALAAFVREDPVEEEGDVEAGGFGPGEPDPEEPPHVEPSPAPQREGVYTRTLAELYLKQGLPDRSLEVFEALVERSPGDDDLRRRMDEVRSLAADRATAEATRAEEEMEALARDLSEASPVTGALSSPFAWDGVEDDEQGGAAPQGPPVGDYFRGLLRWRLGETTPGATAHGVVSPAVHVPEADGTVGDITSRAPAPAEGGTVVDIASLAPAPAEGGAVLDVADLAPDPVEGGTVVGVTGLAPGRVDGGRVVDVAELAPEPGSDGPVVDIGDLAPAGPDDGDGGDEPPSDAFARWLNQLR